MGKDRYYRCLETGSRSLILGIDTGKRRGGGAFFGRRHGKSLRALQTGLMETLLPGLRLDLSIPATTDLKPLFSAHVDTVRMEIGFGGGEHLLHEAKRFPNTGFIGVEPFVNGMAKLVTYLHEEPMGSLRLYDEDAGLVLDWLPDNSLSGIDLFYPDPWHKSRHHKRRFVSPENLVRMVRVLKSGSLFRFASDIEHYVNWTLQHVEENGSFEFLATSADDWRKPYEAWPGTRYEAKAFREGRTPAYLTFRKL